MQNAHGYAWECRAPSHDPIIFEQEFEFQDHACEAHGVPEQHLGTLSGVARRPILEKILDCPFGDDFSAPEKGESSSVFSTKSLYLHVATHMKDIALLAFLKLPSEDDNKYKEVGSGSPLESDGVAKLPESMYSVLTDENLDFLDEARDGVPNMLEEGNASSIDRLDLEKRDEAGMTSLRTEMSYRNMTPETIDGMFETLIDQNMLTVPDHPPHPSHHKAGTKRSSLSNMGTQYTGIFTEP